MENNFRHELKYIIDIHDFHYLKSRLAGALYKDPFAGEDNRYHVRSLYFDDVDDTCLHDKLDGVENRDKFRIRIYNKGRRVIKFEKKEKYNDCVRKRSMTITYRECLDILNSDVSCLSAAGEGLRREVYLAFRTRLLRPVILVDYMREAYVYPPLNVRVTFDMDMAACAGSPDLFNERLPTVNVLSRPALILEIKYRSFIPDFIVSLLQGAHTTKQALSKYLMCRETA
ncbi:MAG: polyphosphate polymerase domain-containing protein [Spirochaetales bacterium]|nr:polyphosphate polymerase domain-containing protein [Spirochaetales bacterium]